MCPSPLPRRRRLAKALTRPRPAVAGSLAFLCVGMASALTWSGCSSNPADEAQPVSAAAQDASPDDAAASPGHEAGTGDGATEGTPMAACLAYVDSFCARKAA